STALPPSARIRAPALASSWWPPTTMPPSVSISLRVVVRLLSIIATIHLAIGRACARGPDYDRGVSAVGVERVISAAGFVTTLGGGPLPDAVRAAMDEAAAGTWRPDDLQAWASEEIAKATGAEAGWVTAGAA